jgi:hypothetical protein
VRRRGRYYLGVCVAEKFINYKNYNYYNSYKIYKMVKKIKKQDNSSYEEKMTTIALPMKVKEGLQEYGMKGESYADILERLLKSANERLIHEVLMNTSNCVSIEEARAELNKKWPRSK